MKPNLSECDPSRIEAFLADKLVANEESQLLNHLNSCDSCRQQMTESAADQPAWNEAERFLKDEAHDSILLSSVIGIPDEDPLTTPTAQINSVLSVLTPTDDPEMLGRLGGYEVSGVIGSGGMGVVMKAFDRSLDRPVAIKVLAPHLASSGAARKRFAREAKAAAAVLHPNVVAIHGVSNDAALPYLVMPYVRGPSLQRRLDEQGPLETTEILRIGQQVAAGLEAAHAQGLVHRDIKPANIMLANGIERVAITDFGLARAVDDATMTRSGVIAGTPQYMSPEQARGGPIDSRSDLFSLGSVLYTMCTGRPPFRAETSFGVLRRITDDVPRDIRQINPAIPVWLCRLIEQLLIKEPGRRIQTAVQVEQLLQQCLAHVEQPSQKPLPISLSQPSRTVDRIWARFAIPIVLASVGLVGWSWANDWWATAKSHPQDKAKPSRPAVVSESSETPPWNDGVFEALEENNRSLNTLGESVKQLWERSD